MKAFIISVFLLLISTVSYADEDVCDLSKGEIPKAQIISCVKGKIETSKILASTVASFEDNADAASGIASWVFDDDIYLQAKNEYSVVAIVLKVISLTIEVFRYGFLIGGAAVIISIIFKGASQGEMTTTEKLIWSVLITVLTGFMFFDGSVFVVQVGFFIAIFLGLISYFNAMPLIYSAFLDDESSLNAELNQQAAVFARTAAVSQIQINFNDIVASRKLLARFAVTPEYGKYKVDVYGDFLSCIATTAEKNSNPSFYVPPVIAKISNCVKDKLDYEKYDTGFIEDRKDDKSASAVVMKMFAESNPEARRIALMIANNPCAMAYNIEQEKDEFLSACLKTNDKGMIESENGYAKFATGTVTPRSEITAAIKALENKYKKEAFAEMVKYAVSKKAKKEKIKIELEKLSKILKVGLKDDAEYKQDALSVIKIDFVNKVIVKAGNLQQGFDFVSNVINFTDTSDILDLEEYFDIVTASDGSLVKGKMLSALNTMTGNGVTNLGLQYEDCYQKSQCYGGAKNPLKTIYQTSQTVQTTLTGLSLGAYATGKMLQAKSETLTKTDPIQNRRGMTLENIGVKLFILNGLLGLIVIVIFKITVLRVIEDFLAALMLALSSGLIVTLALFAVFLNYFLIRDDYFTVQDLVKKMNVYKVLLSVPMIVFCFSLTLGFAPWLQFISSIGLNALFNAELADLQGISGIGDFMLAAFQIIIYISAFIAAYAIIYKEFYEKGMSDIDEILKSQGRHNQGESEYAYGKVKNFINKMV